MRRLAPIDNRTWRRFLESQGAEYARTTGDHVVYKKEGLRRALIFRARGDIPLLHIKTNLQTLGISTAEFLKWLDEN